MRTKSVENKVVTYQLIMEILEDLRQSALKSNIGTISGVEQQKFSKNITNIYQVISYLKNKKVEEISAEDYIDIFKSVIKGLTNVKLKVIPYTNEGLEVDTNKWDSDYGGLNLHIDFTLKDVYIAQDAYDKINSF